MALCRQHGESARLEDLIPALEKAALWGFSEAIHAIIEEAGEPREQLFELKVL